MKNPIAVLGLTNKEEQVLKALLDGLNTPVQISKKTGISRPGIYAILAGLKERGLVTSHINQGKRSWHTVDPRHIDEAFSAAKQLLTGSSEKNSELKHRDEVGIKLHRGKKAIQELLNDLFSGHNGKRYRGLQGDRVFPAWKELIGQESLNALNRTIKSKDLIVEAVLPRNYFPRAISMFGVEWARDFEGRAYQVSEIEEKYFDHGAEIFLFRDAVYLASMSEALIIEIRHSEIQKMLALLLTFVQDHARTIDGNAELRALIQDYTTEKA